MTIAGDGGDAIRAVDGEDEAAVRREDRRRRRFLAGGFAVLSVAIALIVVLVCSPLKAFLEDDGGQAEGERILAAITLPDGWHDSDVTFEHGWKYPPGHKAWVKRLSANTGDLATNLQSLQAAMRASGWGEASCAATRLPDQPNCAWFKGDFVIVSFFPRVADETSCPGGQGRCARIDFILYPRAQAPADLRRCVPTSPGGNGSAGPSTASGRCEPSAALH